jgi:hypothetical protein
MNDEQVERRDTLWRTIEILHKLGLTEEAHAMRVIYDTHCRLGWRG